MRKVGSTTDTADANGEYTNGNVANGISPTIINAEMMNTFQRELVNVVEGAGLELDPDDDSQVLKAIGGGRLLNIVTFTKSGTYTPTKGTKRVRVKIWGAGGSGRGIAAQGGATSGAGGGYVEGIYQLPVGVSFPIVVGKGGAPVAAGNGSDGVGGGESSFSALSLLATGGGGGSIGNPKGGVGSSPSVGLIISVSGQGGQGGSGNNLGGVGGAAHSSFGGLPHVGTAGDAGGYPGGGGAGASYDSTPQASGAGSDGLVIIEEIS